MGNIPKTDIYDNVQLCEEVIILRLKNGKYIMKLNFFTLYIQIREIEGIKILRYEVSNLRFLFKLNLFILY